MGHVVKQHSREQLEESMRLAQMDAEFHELRAAMCRLLFGLALKRSQDEMDGMLAGTLHMMRGAIQTGLVGK